MKRTLPGRWWLALAIITMLAGALRLYAIGSLPPGLYHDEAYHGLDALGVLAGHRPLYFQANNGREPLFIYLVAVSVALLGRTPMAVRLPSALLGLLTVPASFLMARAMFGRRVGLLVAFVTATTFWHLNLSRVGFRAVALPLFIALALWQLWRGLKEGRRGPFLLAGAFYGLSFYTYLAARFTLFALLLFFAYLAWRHKDLLSWPGVLAFVLVALLVASPLGIYALTHPHSFFGRLTQVSILNPAINQGDLPGTLARHIVGALGMFLRRGDFIPRHNLPYRPVFDPLMGLFFSLGLVISVIEARRRAEHAFVLLWLVVMLLPTILAEDCPHFLRGVGILPVVFVLPALGLEAAWAFLEERFRLLGQVALVLVLVLSLGWTSFDYFLRHASSEAVYYNFEAGAVELATEINRFLEEGTFQERRLYLAGRLWRDWASLRFLVAPSPQLVILDGETPPPVQVRQVMLIVWPFEDYSSWLALLPPRSLITAWEGAKERGDLEKEARLLYLAFHAGPPEGIPRNLNARFEKGIRLLGYELDASSPERLRLRLYWEAGERVGEDYTVFVHLVGEGGLVAQDDSLPARGYYPTSRWRPGDIIGDEHLLDLPAPYDPARYQLVVGLYRLETMQRLRVLDEDGVPRDDRVVIPD